MILASLLEPLKLLEVVIAALVSGVGVTGVFGLAVLSLARFSERRTRAAAALAGYGLLSVLCLAACVAAIVYGIILLARH